jgi:hypothetical protein
VHALVERSGVHEQREQQRFADEFRWDERQRRREKHVGDHRQLLRRSLHLGHEPGERLGRRRERKHSAGDPVHAVQPIVEARDDSEVATTAPDRPEEVRVSVGVDLDDAAVGGHDLGPEQVVDRQPALAHEVTHPAAEREPTDAYGRRVAEGGGETVRCGRDGDVAGGESAGRARDALDGVDLDRGEAAQVEHDAALARSVPRLAVAAAAHGQLDAGLARKRDDQGHLAGVGGSRDRSGVPVHRGQEDAPRRVVTGVAGTEDRPGKLGAKLRDRETGLQSSCVHCGLLRRFLRSSIVATAERSGRMARRFS